MERAAFEKYGKSEADVPVWADFDYVSYKTSIPDAILRRLARPDEATGEVFVRTRKFGDDMRARTVYRFQDVLDWCEAQPEPNWVRDARSRYGASAGAGASAT